MAQSRQLAAIMFTDIVGYTALMGKDEQRAFELLEKNRQIQKPIIEQNNGKWIKELGDGVMASFNTVSDAVNAAIEIQEQCNAAKEFQLRIGIHQGEVVIENHDVFGDAVNIASRIQSIASPGTIFVSEVVHHNMSNKNDIQTEFVRTEKLKNVIQPVKIYRIKSKTSASIPRDQRTFFKTPRASKTKTRIIISGGLLLILCAGYFVYNYLQKKEPANSVSSADKSIAVLPFVNLSNDKEQEYFSDGLSEELLNLLAEIPELKVIGRTSSFSFKGKNEDLRSIAQKLGVTHLLEGSIRKDGNTIRVTAHLINGTDGSRIWNHSYNKDMQDVFKLQDEIAQRVVTELQLKLGKKNSRSRAGSGNTEIYNLLLQGNYFFDKLDKDNIEKAIGFYHRALAIDSTDARVWGKLANAISRQAWQNYIDQKTGYEKARQAALKCIFYDSMETSGHQELADIKLYHDFDWKGAEESFLKALSLDPENHQALYGMGGGLYFALGRWKEAIRLMNKCIELDPLRPISHLNLGNILTHAGQTDEAIPYFKKALELNPQFQRGHLYTGRNYLLLEKPQLALKEMQQENLEVFRAFGLALTYFSLGRKREADDALDDFTNKYQDQWSYLLAELHAFRGEKEKALALLETALIKKDSWLIFLKGDPLLKNLENDTRFESFLKKMNLPLD